MLHQFNTVSAQDLLYEGAREGNLQKMQAARKAGANPNLPDHHQKWSALHYAIGMDAGKPTFPPFNKTSTIQFLLSAGADPNLQNLYGDTPLHMAAHTGMPAYYNVLLAAGANPNLKNQLGMTPQDAFQATRANLLFALNGHLDHNQRTKVSNSKL